MDGVIDPALLGEAPRGNGIEAPTNGETAPPITARPLPPLAPRPHTFSNADVASWGASNFAPWRDRNEAQTDYDERLTHVSRKAPLREACNKLRLKVAATASLDKLRTVLSKHWFTPASGSSATVRKPNKSKSKSVRHAAGPADVVASVVAPVTEPILLGAPRGALPVAPSNARGELRGTVPLFHIGPLGGASVSATSTSTVKKGKQCATGPAGVSTHQIPVQDHLQSELPARPRPRAQVESHNDAGPSTLPPPRPSAPAQSRDTAGPSTLQPQRRTQALPHNEAGPSRLPPPPPQPSTLLPSAFPHTPAPSSSQSRATLDSPIVHIVPVDYDEEDEDNDAALIRGFDVAEGSAYEILGYEEDDDEEDLGEDEDDDDGPEDMEAFRTGVRVDAVKRAEGNRRAGGLKTQRAMVRMWEEFVARAIKAGHISDGIVDEHSLLLYIKFCAERAKRDRKGFDIDGTFVGASHLKKLFFGALRIRKEQDAADPSLALKRKAVSVIIYDAIKNQMDEALTRERNGLAPKGDAPDIRANTFLSQVTEEELRKIGRGFLSHRQLRLCIWGHLSWTAQHASGNRGDDFWALKLAEMQPHELTHPDKKTLIPCVLGMQGEEKAGKRGMRTVINPVYSVFIANLRPEICPLGAFAFYFHYIYDEKDIAETMNIDWTVNKSWRMIRVLHGPKSPSTPFSEQSLYNPYCKAYIHAGFKSRLKAHLPRHLLGYKQEAMGQAILGAAGYQADEPYDPVWRHVRVPEAFLQRVCPMAEGILEKVAGDAYLSGAAKHWMMVIDSREILFQCGAAIWQICPESSLFRLPAFQEQDVRDWMTGGFPTALSALQAAAGSPIDLARIENAALRDALREVRNLLTAQSIQLKEINSTLHRRTAIFTPARGFSSAVYHQNTILSSEMHDIQDGGPLPIQVENFSSFNPSTPSCSIQSPRTPGAPSPSTPHTHTLAAQVQLVLPPLGAFFPKNAPTGLPPPGLAMQSARWKEDIFEAIRQPDMCWPVWGPSKTMDQWDSIIKMWDIYAVGARLTDDNGQTIRMKPPLKIVEQHFGANWRLSDDKQACLKSSCLSLISSFSMQENNKRKKAWERFREIPQWIDLEMIMRNVSLETVVDELESIRTMGIQGPGPVNPRGLNWLVGELASRRKLAKSNINPNTEPNGVESVDGVEKTRKRAAALDPRRPVPKKAKTAHT